jgi:hypothetical protein
MWTVLEHPNELPLKFSKEQFSRAEIVEDRQDISWKQIIDGALF